MFNVRKRSANVLRNCDLSWMSCLFAIARKTPHDQNNHCMIHHKNVIPFFMGEGNMMVLKKRDWSEYTRRNKANHLRSNVLSHIPTRYVPMMVQGKVRAIILLYADRAMFLWSVMSVNRVEVIHVNNPKKINSLKSQTSHMNPNNVTDMINHPIPKTLCHIYHRKKQHDSITDCICIDAVIKTSCILYDDRYIYVPHSMKWNLTVFFGMGEIFLLNLLCILYFVLLAYCSCLLLILDVTNQIILPVMIRTHPHCHGVKRTHTHHMRAKISRLTGRESS